MNSKDSSKKNIVGLSFRDLSQNSYDNASGSEDFIFLDKDITERDLSWIGRVGNSLVNYFNTRRGFLAFIIDFFEYFFSRLRVLWILISVLLDIVFRQFDVVKDGIVRRMFWGRGSFLKYVVQVATIVISFILVLSYIYRTPTITSANDEDLDYIAVAEGDLVVMNATLNTLVPKDRERRGVEKYIVKHGDTLSSISGMYEISVETVKWANNLTSDLVKPGQELDIPPADGVLIKVAKNETLASIAKKYDGNEQGIADFNWLDYPFTLYENQELFIPDGRMPAPPTRTTVASAPRTYTSGSAPRSGNVGTADPNVGRFLGWPVAGNSAKISQYYKGTLHRGIDIADRNLPNVIAPAAGNVIFAGCAGSCPPLGSTWGGTGYAWSIQIDHGNGYTTWYAHLKNIYVRTGQSVSRGQAIGQLGSTGRSTGPHLHFELRRGVGHGSQINPLPYTAW
jgi:murein DD-endopeptidase MepM/ murein hydrolase activator NlpD